MLFVDCNMQTPIQKWDQAQIIFLNVPPTSLSFFEINTHTHKFPFATGKHQGLSTQWQQQYEISCLLEFSIELWITPVIVSFFFLAFFFFFVAAKKAALSLNQFISFKGKDNKTVISGRSTKGATGTLILKLIKSRAVS